MPRLSPRTTLRDERLKRRAQAAQAAQPQQPGQPATTLPQATSTMGVQSMQGIQTPGQPHMRGVSEPGQQPARQWQPTVMSGRVGSPEADRVMRQEREAGTAPWTRQFAGGVSPTTPAEQLMPGQFAATGTNPALQQRQATREQAAANAAQQRQMQSRQFWMEGLRGGAVPSQDAMRPQHRDAIREIGRTFNEELTNEYRENPALSNAQSLDQYISGFQNAVDRIGGVLPQELHGEVRQMFESRMPESIKEEYQAENAMRDMQSRVDLLNEQTGDDRYIIGPIMEGPRAGEMGIQLDPAFQARQERQQMLEQAVTRAEDSYWSDPTPENQQRLQRLQSRMDGQEMPEPIQPPPDPRVEQAAVQQQFREMPSTQVREHLMRPVEGGPPAWQTIDPPAIEEFVEAYGKKRSEIELGYQEGFTGLFHIGNLGQAPEFFNSDLQPGTKRTIINQLPKLVEDVYAAQNTRERKVKLDRLKQFLETYQGYGLDNLGQVKAVLDQFGQ